LAAQGQPEEASRVLHDALQSNPESGLLHYNLAATLLQIRTNGPSLSDEALLHFVKASRDKVDSPAFWCAYGQLLNHLGRHAEAATQLQRAVSEDESMAAAQFQLALAEERLGQYADAIAHYEKVLTLNKDDTDTLNSLALLYATATNSEVRTAKMAVQLAIRACDATSNQNARYMDTLARSYAADGDFFQAITWEDKAIHRATQLNELALAREFEAREAMFMEHKSL
jgi:tetratricopeptide (TPR) repeat protein